MRTKLGGRIGKPDTRTDKLNETADTLTDKLNETADTLTDKLESKGPSDR